MLAQPGSRERAEPRAGVIKSLERAGQREEPLLEQLLVTQPAPPATASHLPPHQPDVRQQEVLPGEAPLRFEAT